MFELKPNRGPACLVAGGSRVAIRSWCVMWLSRRPRAAPHLPRVAEAWRLLKLFLAIHPSKQDRVKMVRHLARSVITMGLEPSEKLRRGQSHWPRNRRGLCGGRPLSLRHNSVGFSTSTGAGVNDMIYVEAYSRPVNPKSPLHQVQVGRAEGALIAIHQRAPSTKTIRTIHSEMYRATCWRRQQERAVTEPPRACRYWCRCAASGDLQALGRALSHSEHNRPALF
ncbi:hypothetical protein RRG08_049596 [Elysia crispata]|uniref:Uncharacterized protein n=1 Tax=Elysia crispata TaxID=231223 RepID=A0AAE1AVP4_9GAST|nr:hypothetical protein RRG08_049596 [Elysia crispata]